MLDWFKTLPSELPILIGLSVILVVIPATLTISIRVSLHQHLKDLNKKIRRLLTYNSSGEKSQIVQDLEKRFKQASDQLENVNTGALIDEIYSQETFSFLWFKLQCEQWDYFSRLLPNLLLAFGLVGTFAGITFNLYNMSRTLGQTSLETSQLINQLQPYLQGMGIAFITSLIALVFSSLLTIINLIYNTSVAKYEFLSSLEDYLDNIYKPDVQGDTRLDKAVEKMVKKQEEFLTRFHERVGKVLEDTFGKAADRLVEEHAESNRLARQVYENFRDAAGTISSSAHIFRDASLVMGSQTVILKETTGQMQKCLERIVHFSNTIQKSAEIIERSKFSEKLEQTTTNLQETTSSLAETQTTFSNSVTSLVTNIEQVAEDYRKSIEISKQVHSQLYDYSTHLEEASTNLKEGSKVFLKASEAIRPDDLITQLASLNQNATAIIPIGQGIEDYQDTIKLLSEVMIKNIEVTQKLNSKIESVGEDLIKSRNALEQNIYNVGQEITTVLLDEGETKTNKMQVINEKFDYLNDRINALLVLAEDTYNR